MAFCPNCGKEIPEDTKFCPGCGAQIGAAEQAPQPVKEAEAIPVFEEEEINAGQPWSLLAYLSIAVLFPIFMAKDNKYARFNANQGLVLLIATAICTCIPFVGWVLEIPLIVFDVLQIIAVCKKQVRVVPLLGKIKILK